MLKRIFILAIILIPIIFTACSNDSGGIGSVPDVGVVTDPASGDGSTDNESAGSSPQVVLISPIDGSISINGETLSVSQYNESNSQASITAVDENGNSLTVTVDNSNNIIVYPADDSVDGTYTVTIETGERDYTIVITVTDGTAVVDSAVSVPHGHSMVLNMDQGVVVLSGGETLAITSSSSGSYQLGSSINSITVVDASGNSVEFVIDASTGDIVTSGDGSGPYVITVVLNDGSVVTIVTNTSGNITTITLHNSALMCKLESGSLTSGTTTLEITSQTDGSWVLKDGVEFISASAAGGSIALDIDNIWIDTATGNIMLTGTGSSTVQTGPYEIKISINGETYIIITDASGNITGILPGKTLLNMTDGTITFDGTAVLQAAVQSGTVWAFSDSISDIEAADADGNSITIQVGSTTGNIVTSNSFTDPVTIVFNYTDSDGNVVTYTLVVANGSLVSYQALITEPGSDFDFSTVTNVKMTLRTVDADTGLPVSQASIDFVKEDGSTNWQGFTNSNGYSIFQATVEKASSTASVKVEHSGYETVDCEISGIGQLVEFGKKISLTAVDTTPVVVDSDGDGVADEDDDYPNDPEGAKEKTGVYTLAFEDSYPNRGDADFNDLVVQLTIIEKIDSENRLRKIALKTKLLASGAGYTNKFGININGTRYILIANPKADGEYALGSHSNAAPGETFIDTTEVEHTPIVFDGGIDRNSIAPMPYDPFILCNGDFRKQSHLSFVATSFTGKVVDSNGFPWAILVPNEWAWPYENRGSSIYKAYSEFDDWYLSEGEVSADWYLRPNSGYVFIRP